MHYKSNHRLFLSYRPIWVKQIFLPEFLDEFLTYTLKRRLCQLVCKVVHA